MEKTDLVVTRLTSDEAKELENWREHKNKPSLAPALSVRLFELFLNGSSCEEIVKLNNGVYTLGQVLEARVRDQWDDKKDRYLADLYGGVLDRVKQTQIEAVGFTSDLLAVAHKQFGQKLKKYLQNGDETELKDVVSLGSLQGYSKAIEILLKLTGQEKKGDSKVGIQVNNLGQGSAQAPGSGVVVEVGVGTEKLNSDLAMKVLQFLEAKDEE